MYSLISKTTIEKARSNGDQLRISITSSNKKIGEEYVNTLVREYDFDGIYDRQLGYKNTMDFVDSRSEILEKELEKVEIRKREFKSENKILYIENDASVNASQKQLYSNELFDAITQRDLLVIVKESIINDKFQYLPLNIGIDNNEVNSLISSYNEDINLRNTFLLSTGRNNPAVRNIELKINDNFDVFNQTIDRFINSIEIKIQNLEKVENQYSDDYKDLAYKEKILRAIERELSVKESLFLLLLQKREEAAINYAVIKPSIKVIDPARSKNKPVYPDKNLVFIIATFSGLFIPIGFIFIFFLFDNKIHTKSQLDSLAIDIPVIGEVPHINDRSDLNIISDSNSRLPLIESIRMIIANLNFSVFNKTSKSEDNVILVTSSVKGEGKT